MKDEVLDSQGFEQDSPRPYGTGLLATLVVERLGYNFLLKLHGF